jgi:hypothetical protein
LTVKLPLNEKKLLLLNIAQNVMKSTIVRQVRGIDKVFIQTDDKKGSSKQDLKMLV